MNKGQTKLTLLPSNEFVNYEPGEEYNNNPYIGLVEKYIDDELSNHVVTLYSDG